MFVLSELGGELMRRRMMMMKNRVVNLFDKNSEYIIFHSRLTTKGDPHYNQNESQANKSFISHFVDVKPGESYTLIRKPTDASISSYNRWSFYDVNKSWIGNGGSIVELNTITIPESCYYIRFNGLITDIDNVKFYKI